MFSVIAKPFQAGFASVAKDPRIAAAYNYWLSKASPEAGLIPGRQDIDPLEMREFLTCVTLLDVERDQNGYIFRHRLAGTHLYELFGRDVTGLAVPAVTGTADDAAVLNRRFTFVVEKKIPLYGISPVRVKDRNFIYYEHLTMPLAADGMVPDMLFGVRCAVPRTLPIDELSVPARSNFDQP
jgi:hypothetical protein